MVLICPTLCTLQSTEMKNEKCKETMKKFEKSRIKNFGNFLKDIKDLRHIRKKTR